MYRRLCAWAFVALSTAHEAVCAAGIGNQAYGIEKRQAPISLLFTAPDDIPQCQPATVLWEYSGPPINMTLLATNVNVPQAVGAVEPIRYSQTISTKVNPAIGFFIWPSVNVTAGTWQLRATISSQRFLQDSPSFLVLGGDDSCLTGSISTATSDFVIPTSPASPVAATQSLTGRGGVIAGIIIGCVAALAMAGLGVFFFLRRPRAKRATTRTQEFSRGWNGATSTTGSVRTVVGAATDKYGGNLSEEKLGQPPSRRISLSSYDSHAMTLATLPSLHHKGSANQDYDGNDSTFTHSTEERYVPPFPSNPNSPEAKKDNGASFGRKRKPAPVYNESEVPPFPSSHSPQLQTPPTPSPVNSMLDGQFGSPSGSSGHYMTRTASTSAPRPNTGDTNTELLHKSSFGLEGKQMHYLMPDLPAGAGQL